MYRHQLDVVVRYMDDNYPEEMHSFDEGHDITGILGKIANEKATARQKAELPKSS